MAMVQTSPALRYGSRGDIGDMPRHFPAGMKVLVVDDDVICLSILKQMLTDCLYKVTTCIRATVALSLLRENKGSFDVILSDVHMPEMDGFKLLELVGLEMDLPVVMISADGRTSAVMRGITHGACDYLIKPVRIEELRNLWQHVVRRKQNKNKERSNSLENSDHIRQVTDDADHDSSVNFGSDGSCKSQKKKKTREDGDDDDDDELDNGDPSSKKSRVVWSVDLHQQFVNAVNQLGIDKAVPKKILELMIVPGLTRENVASHLQKYRMYLKRLSGVALHFGVLPNSIFGAAVTNANASLLDRLGFPSLSPSGQIPPQALAALEAELLGQPPRSLAAPAVGQPSLQQASVQGPKRIPVEQGITLGPNTSNRFPQSNVVGPTNNIGGLNSYHRPINVPPSSLADPSQAPNFFKVGYNPVLMNQSSIVVPSQLPSGLQTENAPIPSSLDFSLLSTSVSCADSSLPCLVPDQGPERNFGFVGEDNCIPDEYLVDDIVSPTNDSSQRNISVGDEEGEARDFFEFYGPLYSGEPSATP